MSFFVREMSDITKAVLDFTASTHLGPHQLLCFPKTSTEYSDYKSALIKAVSKNPRMTCIEADGNGLAEETIYLKNIAQQIIQKTSADPKSLHVVLINNFDPFPDYLDQTPVPINKLGQIFEGRKVLVVYLYLTITTSDLPQFVDTITNQIIKIVDDSEPKATFWSAFTNQISFATTGLDPLIQDMIDLLEDSRNIKVLILDGAHDINLLRGIRDFKQNQETDLVLIINNYNFASVLITEELAKSKEIEINRRLSSDYSGVFTCRMILGTPKGKMYMLY